MSIVFAILSAFLMTPVVMLMVLHAKDYLITHLAQPMNGVLECNRDKLPGSQAVAALRTRSGNCGMVMAPGI
jgi:hypothetical protein